MSKPEVKIGTGDWFDNNRNRIGIYNSDYIGHFTKCMSHSKPWKLAARDPWVCTMKFATQEDATDFVRELLNTQAVS